MRCMRSLTITPPSAWLSMVGFDRVAALAREAGVKSARGTPAMAIGAYDATPLDMAGAYTVFANGGVHLDPWMLASVRTATGDVMTDYTPDAKQVLDPRVAYLTTNMMEAVMQRRHRAPAVRDLGFTAPAAGKTGTSHDAWFAGFTSNLLCIVWVGNDDYTDIKIAGRPRRRAHLGGVHEEGRAAAAVLRHQGIHAARRSANWSTSTRSPTCFPTAPALTTYTAAFLDGTAPTDTCSHPPDQRNLFQKIFGLGNKSGN